MKHSILLLFILFFISSCGLIISGSYPHSENYTFDIPRQKLITKIKEFKDRNHVYKVMTTFENGENGELPDGMNLQDTSSVFYGCFFYIPSLQTTVNCVVNMSKEIPTSPTLIQLVGMTKSRNMGNWKRINTKDLSKSENVQVKKAFESQILNKLGAWKRN